MHVRRVVTGHDAAGRAVVASDTQIDGFRPAVAPGSEFHKFVQNGTRHAWRNHGDSTARLAVFIVGAHHERIPPS